MEKYVIIDKKVLIYGAGSVGKVVSDMFNKNGITIDAYIDQRADTIKKNNNKLVFSAGELENRIRKKDDYVIIITIRNVFEHSCLAKQFYFMGFKNIIYKPNTILRGSKNPIQESINNAYEQITGKFEIPKDKVACYELEKYEICDFGLYKRFEEDVLVRMPAELLFSNTNYNASIWSCQNFYSNYIAVDLYEAFDNIHNGELEEKINYYIERFALPGAKTMGVNTDGIWRELLIDSRLKVYYEMEYNLWMDYDFFIQNCVKVKSRKTKGFELITSGKNRVSFLIAKGYRYIPVKIKKSDYENYLNVEEAENIVNYIEQTNLEIFAPIPHPYFYKTTAISPDYAVECVRPIARFLAEQIYLENNDYCFNKYHLAFCINDEGYMSRYFKMLGYEVERIITRNQKLCLLTDNLFNYSLNEFECSEKSLFCSIISCDIQRELILPFIKRTNKFVILIFSVSISEKLMIANHYGFCLKGKIFEAIWDGKMIQANIYERMD